MVLENTTSTPHMRNNGALMKNYQHASKTILKFSCVFSALLAFIGINMPTAEANMARVALIIGNANYAPPAELANPANDARAINAKLIDNGFTTHMAIDADQFRLTVTIDQFLDDIREAKIIFIYYAGHGVQLGGTNFIVPTDFSIAGRTVNDVGLYSISSLLANVEAMAPPDASKIVVLDACRNNPWAPKVRTKGTRSSQGLARIELAEPPTSMGGYFRIIAFATAAGSVAEDGKKTHSPFTEGLLRFIGQKGLEVSEMFRRTAAHVIEATEGSQKPEYLMQTSRALFFQVPSITNCDRLAVEAQNYIGLPGIAFEDIDATRAIPACEAALRMEPESPRLMHNLARAYERGRLLKDALDYYRRAAEFGAPASLNALGVMYLAGCGMKKRDVAKGVELMMRAARFGSVDAERAVVAHDLFPHLSPLGRQIIKSALFGRGHYSGQLDGTPDPALQDSISFFQQQNGLKQSGLTLETIHELGVPEAVPDGFRCN